MRTRTHWVAALLLGAVAACGDQPTSPVTTAPLFLDPRLNVTTTASLGSEISTLIGALFPKGLETAAGTRWETVASKYAAGQTDPAQLAVAKKLVVELAQWVESKRGQMDPSPVPGESRESAAARLVSYMALYVFQGPGTPVPTYNVQADATFEVVSPTQDDTVTTPAGYAGVNFDPGTVSEPVIVTITQTSQAPYPLNCQGPLTTRLCQYPLFYDFHVFPDVAFQQPVHIAVCHVTTNTARKPLDPGDESVHDRLRLAHPLPANAAQWTPGGTQLSGPGENIEILPLSPSVGSSGVNCAGAASTLTAFESSRIGRALGTLASAVGRALTPAPLYAVDQGPEHMAMDMSPFNSVDPQGQPDLAVENASAVGTAQASPPEAYQGQSVTVSYSVTNDSPLNGGFATATSQPTFFGTYVSTDATVNASDMLVGTVQALPAFPPDASGPSVTQVFSVPMAMVPGTYYIGGYVTPPTIGLTESSTLNNGAGVAFVVRAPVVTSVAVAPASSSLLVGQTAPLTATVGGLGAYSSAVTWSSQNPSVATVSASGVVTAVSPGSTTINATGANAVVGSASVTVASLNTGAETGDVPWTPSGQWNAVPLPGVTHTLYPTYVSAAPGDNSAGALPSPFAGQRSWWFGSAATGSYIGTFANSNTAGSGGYGTGTESGTLSSPSFTVPAGTTTLQFRSWFEVESVDVHAFDLMLVYFHPTGGPEVEIKRLNPSTDQNGGAATPFTSGGFNQPPVWAQYSADLSAFAGQTGHLHFYFNTQDSQYNGFRGWLVDDVVLSTSPPALIARVAPGGTLKTGLSLSLSSTSEVFAPTLPPAVRQ